MAKKTKPKAKAKPQRKSVKVKAKVKAKPKAKPAPKPKVKPKLPKKSGHAKAKVASKPKAKSQPKAKSKVAVSKAKTSSVSIQVSKPVAKAITKKPVATNGHSPTKRYGDKDLVEFKGIIIDKLLEARKDWDLLRSSMSHLDDHGTDDTSPTFKLMEDGSDVLTKEETAQLAARQQKFIKHLEDALVRIENKSYGICRVTGNLIPKERLRIVPHATLSIEAKQKQF